MMTNHEYKMILRIVARDYERHPRRDFRIVGNTIWMRMADTWEPTIESTAELLDYVRNGDLAPYNR